MDIKADIEAFLNRKKDPANMYISI